MKRSFNSILLAGCCIALAVVLATPALASSSRDNDRSKLVNPEDVIYSGIDLWVTHSTSGTYSSFAKTPIPAGFFCEGSQPFTGLVAFQGGGLDTIPAGILGEADTIIQRMDDAIFNQQGMATTRVRFLALSLASIEPLQTECGQFQATIRLNGVQPVTSMRIERTDDVNSGTYSATLAVDAKVTFTPLQGGEPLVFLQSVRFAPNQSVWAREPGYTAQSAQNYARVDLDGDGQAETVIPGPSNFHPGFSLQNGVLARPATSQQAARRIALCLDAGGPPGNVTCDPECHCDPTSEWDDPPGSVCWQRFNCEHCHCPGGPDPRDPEVEPIEPAEPIGK